jgi:hypothetical protein
MDHLVVEVNGEHVTYSITDAIMPGLVACVVEIGGLGDMAILEPHSRKRLWISPGLEQHTDVYGAITRAIAVAKELNFLGNPEDT